MMTSIGWLSVFEIQRLAVKIADRRIGEAGAGELDAGRIQLIGPEARDPARDHEIGLEGVDRGAQRLQHVAFTTEGARNSPDATRANSSRSVKRSWTRLAWTSIARASAMPSIANSWSCTR